MHASLIIAFASPDITQLQQISNAYAVISVNITCFLSPCSKNRGKQEVIIGYLSYANWPV